MLDASPLDDPDVFVVGVPHDLLARLRTELAPFKIPAHVKFRDRLPRNATGKVMKHLLDSADALPFAED